ncbi:ribonucleases P/MRP protein subunit POP1 [Physcia stellaris]|nr:ribonucleases P/MRP protein subunit POP1 [Physcia stellaris]
MRLRLETAKKLESLSKRIQIKRDKAYNLKHNLNGPDPAQKTSTTPKPPRPKKNALATPLKQFSKYRRRQVHKSWLPTHIWHAKRAHMPEPKVPLWRFAIPLSPTDKVHRPTHRAGSSKGCVAWDTSYVSTISVKGVEASLLGLLRALGVEEAHLTGKQGLKWRRGTRFWDGWIRERDGDGSSIAEVQIIWCAQEAKPPEDTITAKKKDKRQFFLRVHPSAFLQVWIEVLKVAKIQKPSPDVEDLRFEIGSIEIAGPGSTEALVGILHPKSQPSTESSDDSPDKVWSRLSTLTNPSALPASTILSFNIHDPRLFHPPRTIKPTGTDSREHDLLTLLATWPPDTTSAPSHLYTQNARYAASRLPSQKAINRRKGDALPGNYPHLLPTDPAIPVILFATRAPSLNLQGSWTLLLPWKCVLPVWYSLMHYPLSTGGNPRFGGLQERRQILFEQGQPWLPGDYQGTRAGWQWEIMEREKRKKAWEKRPKSKRVSWDAVDLGDGRKGEIGQGWACDWERLFKGPPPPGDEPSTQHSSTKDTPAAKQASSKEPPGPASQPQPTPSAPQAPPDASKLPTLPTKPPLDIVHFPSALVPSVSSIPTHALVSVHLTLLHRGSPTTCARIYRLPSDPTSRKKWHSLLSSIQSKPSSSKHSHAQVSLSKATKKNKRSLPSSLADLPPDAPAHVKRQALARALINGPATPNEEDYPTCPPEEDLIGFVTTGNFDLGRGRGAAVGNLVITRILENSDAGHERKETGEDKGEVKTRTFKREDHLCIVRNAGQNVGRLARWEFI